MLIESSVLFYRNLQRIHHVDFLQRNKVVYKAYKDAASYEIINLCKSIDDSSFSEFPTSVPVLDHNVVSDHVCSKVGDCVAVCYTNKLYPGLVVSVTEGSDMITVRFLSNVGDNRFRYPPIEVCEEVDDRELLCKLTDGLISQGDRRQTYRLSPNDFSLARNLF
jgi:ferredoxin